MIPFLDKLHGLKNDFRPAKFSEKWLTDENKEKMCNEEVQKTFWNRVFFNLNCNIKRLADRMFAERPVTEHDDDKANKIAA